jgi:uncharacterized membrane protein
MLIGFLVYGVFGWCAEIVWTALHDAVRALGRRQRIDPRLAGRTYLWMFPIYGGGGLLFEVVYGRVAGWPWAARGMLYMVGCFAVEYASGWAIRRATGAVPWDYTASRWNVHALIRLDYAPVWFVFGMLLERVEHLAHVFTVCVGA